MWKCFGVEWGERYYSKSPKKGAAAIMAALNQNLYDYSIFAGREASDNFNFTGIIKPHKTDEMIKGVVEKVREIISSGARPLILGGDHSVTYGTLKALAASPPANLAFFDAHLDMADNDPDIEEGKGKKVPFSRATYLRRAIEEGLVKDVICVGIRDCSKQELDFAAANGVKIFTTAETNNRPKRVARELSRLSGPTYISIDIDVLDPSIAPAVSVPVPGGLCVPTLLDLIRAVRSPAGLDITEVCSPVLPDDHTAMAAAFLIREWVTNSK